MTDDDNPESSWIRQDDQHLLVGQERRQARRARTDRVLAHVERLGHGHRDEVGVAQLTEDLIARLVQDTEVPSAAPAARILSQGPTVSGKSCTLHDGLGKAVILRMRSNDIGPSCQGPGREMFHLKL